MTREPDLPAIRDSVAFVGRMSDSLMRVGPFSLGIDGILSWIPGLGELYSAAAGGFIVLQGVRAGLPLPVLGGAAALLAARTVIGATPIVGALAADVFTAHKWAAAMIVRAIDERLADLEGALPARWASGPSTA